MDDFKKIIIVYLEKMLKRPLYKFFVLVLGLPFNIYTYFVYTKEKNQNSYIKEKENTRKELLANGEFDLLEKEVKDQLNKKIKFLNKSISEQDFQKETKRIFESRIEELLVEKMRMDSETANLKETTFVNVFEKMLNNSLFFYLYLVFGIPMYLLILIYSNAYVKFIAERLFMLVFVIFGVTFVVFTILYISPMDPVVNILGNTATQEQVDAMRATYGLDQPYIVQLFSKFKSLITLDPGKSLQGGEEILPAIARKFPITLKLTLFSLFIAILLAVPAGIISAIKPYSSFDYIFMFIALIGLSVPNFWLGMIMKLAFSINTKILPSNFEPDNWKSLIMPCIVLGTGLAASVARMTRASMLEVVNQDYVVTAKAKGLSKNRVVLKHILGNAMIPIVTVIGLQFGGMLGGSSVTEKLFNINGIGKYIIEKQFIPDIPVVLAGVVYIAITISVVNLFIDIVYSFLDPRIKSKMKSY